MDHPRFRVRTGWVGTIHSRNPTGAGRSSVNDLNFMPRSFMSMRTGPTRLTIRLASFAAKAAPDRAVARASTAWHRHWLTQADGCNLCLCRASKRSSMNSDGGNCAENQSRSRARVAATKRRWCSASWTSASARSSPSCARRSAAGSTWAWQTMTAKARNSRPLASCVSATATPEEPVAATAASALGCAGGSDQHCHRARRLALGQRAGSQAPADWVSVSA